jgi:hypothetical protein
VGDRVEALFKEEGKHYRGVITSVNADKTYTVLFDTAVRGLFWAKCDSLPVMQFSEMFVYSVLALVVVVGIALEISAFLQRSTELAIPGKLLTRLGLFVWTHLYMVAADVFWYKSHHSTADRNDNFFKRNGTSIKFSTKVKIKLTQVFDMLSLFFTFTDSETAESGYEGMYAAAARNVEGSKSLLSSVVASTLGNFGADSILHLAILEDTVLFQGSIWKQYSQFHDAFFASRGSSRDHVKVAQKFLKAQNDSVQGMIQGKGQELSLLWMFLPQAVPIAKLAGISVALYCGPLLIKCAYRGDNRDTCICTRSNLLGNIRSCSTETCVVSITCLHVHVDYSIVHGACLGRGERCCFCCLQFSISGVCRFPCL